MGKAFKCDCCKEFYEGRPMKTLYEKDHDRAQKEIYMEWALLCEACAEDFTE